MTAGMTTLMPSPGVCPLGMWPESWNSASGLQRTMSDMSGISQWRNAGPLTAAITGAWIESTLSISSRPREWTACHASADSTTKGLVGSGLGPENSPPPRTAVGVQTQLEYPTLATHRDTGEAVLVLLERRHVQRRHSAMIACTSC